MQVNKLKIAVLPGDGVGIDVTHAALPIFDALNLPIDLTLGDIGWSYWINEGTPIPQRTWDLIHHCDVTLLGAITSKPLREAQQELILSLQSKSLEYVSPVIQLRQQLNLYANVRPCINVQSKINNFNFCVIRENTEGLYAGFDYHPVPQSLKEILNMRSPWDSVDAHDCAVSFRVQSSTGLLRLFEFAFSYAGKENLKRVTFADKPNVLRKSGEFARKLFESVAEKYPHLEAEILNIDAVALWMVKRPEIFGVIVAENMFGDILSDLGAGITGGLGFAPSANIGEKGCYFEPVHGSAPRIKKNSANPSAMFLTISLLLKHFSYNDEAAKIVRAVSSVAKERKHVTYDLGGDASTQDMAKAIIDTCLSLKKSKTVVMMVTGNELVHGAIQDKNAHYYSQTLTENGADIQQQVFVPDDKKIIQSTLLYLLENHDAVILSGGLGPTSDDLTRFALSDAINKDLIFSQDAYSCLAERLNRFGLKVAESNRQQALFPEGSILIDNNNGTAKGCYLKWRGRDIFMLPGPPKEAWPMFDGFVIDKLSEGGYFSAIYRKRFLTLGLIEGEISPKIDQIAKEVNVDTGYLWSYPYLEIKLQTDNEKKLLGMMNKILKEISPNIVSVDTAQDAINCMNSVLKNIVYIMRDEYSEEILNKWKCAYLILSEKTFHSDNAIIVSYNIFPKEENNNILILDFAASFDEKTFYKHQLQIPNRGVEVKHYIEHYLAWQLYKILKDKIWEN